MSKAWDIIAAPKRTAPKAAKSEKRRKSGCSSFLFWVLTIMIFIATALFFGDFANKNFNLGGTPNPTKNSPTPVPSIVNTSPTIKILNGTGQFEETTNVKSLLTSAGYQVNATENALNLYNQTIIYYNAGKETQANAIANVLKKYNPKLQKYATTSNYDIAIIIGTKQP